MRNNMRLTSMIIYGCRFMILALFLVMPCSAQWLSSSMYAPFPTGFPSVFDFYWSYNPFLTLIPPLPTLGPTVLNPVLNPTLAGMPTLTRNAAATLVVLPQPAPAVTAYAPLGTLNLTPSTLVFLILLFTLEE